MASKLDELRQRLADLKAQGRKLQKEAEALEAKDERSEAEDAKLESLEGKLKAVAFDVEQAVESEAKEAERVKRASMFEPIHVSPAVSSGDNPQERQDGGFKNLADFAQSVHKAVMFSRGLSSDFDPRLRAAPTSPHMETGTDEGYMVPPEFRAQIWELVFAEDDLLGRVDMEPTNSNSVELITDTSTPWGATGIQAKWRNEDTQMTETKLTTDPRQVRLHELYAFATASDAMLEDAPRLQDRLLRKAPLAIRWKANDAIIYGTGVGQPLGYFNSGALVSVAKEGSQVADTIVTENVAKMYSRLLPGGISRALWIANSDTLPQLMVMTISNQPIWTPPNAGLANAPGGLLLGRPVLLSEHAKTVGDKGDIQLIDPMGYYAANKRSGIKFDSSMHLYFDFGMQAFRWTFRIGGQPYLSAPVSPANGSSTKSHFVTLDERA